MNIGAMVAINAAATATRARAALVDAFRLSGATAPERARPLVDLGITLPNDSLTELLRTGVVRGVDSRGRPVVPGDSDARAKLFFLDEVAFVRQRDRPSGGHGARALALIIGVILLLTGILVAIGASGS